MSQISDELTPQQYKKYNGQSIMSALLSMGNKGTLEDLSQHIASLIEKPEEHIKSEVLNVLDRGVNDGFLLKRGEYYVLSGKDDFQVDVKHRTSPNKKKSYLQTLETEDDELAKLKERQELRNKIELSLYKMTLPELRKMHDTYVNNQELKK